MTTATTTAETKTVSILSIDAWRYDDGWTWNQWFNVGKIELDEIPTTNRRILRYMREHGYLSQNSCGRVAIEDDGYNLVIIEKGNRMPLFAIAYGEAD